jgi:serine protease Do
VNKARPAVVAIQSRGNGMMGSGSGVIVSKDGLVLTAAHVVDGDTEGVIEVSVVLADGREVKGEVLGRDRTRDAAMVQIKEGTDWPVAEPAPKDSIEQGEWCIAMGHPGGFDPQRGAPIRVGRLWQTNDKAFYRSDCTVSGGDSGGPLFDLEGRVIGIHSSISLDITENRHVPIGVFHEQWDKLKKGGKWGDSRRVLSNADDLTPKKGEEKKPDRRKLFSKPDAPREPAADLPAVPKGSPWLGLALVKNGDAVMVEGVVDGSPAAEAGLKKGDIITDLEGKAPSTVNDVSDVVRSRKPGDKIKLTLKRDGREESKEVTLGEAK